MKHSQSAYVPWTTGLQGKVFAQRDVQAYFKQLLTAMNKVPRKNRLCFETGHRSGLWWAIQHLSETFPTKDCPGAMYEGDL